MPQGIRKNTRFRGPTIFGAERSSTGRSKTRRLRYISDRASVLLGVWQQGDSETHETDAYNVDTENLDANVLDEGDAEPTYNSQPYRADNEKNRKSRTKHWKNVLPGLSRCLLKRIDEEPCACPPLDRRRKKNVLFIESYGPRLEDITYCKCTGSLVRKLVCMGYFPSAPSKPNVAFNLDLLEMFHDILMMGNISKYTFSMMLQRHSERKSKRRCHSLTKLWDYAYFNWMKAQRQAEALLREQIRDNSSSVVGHDTMPDSTDLREMCPACFNRSDNSDNQYYIAVDGNFQQCRYRRKFEPRGQNQQISAPLFMQNNFDYTGNPTRAETGKSGCARHFVAAESLTAKGSYDGKDETGIMGAVCRHGIGIGFMNIYAGERWPPMLEMIKGLIRQCPVDAKFLVMYDIGCKFSNFAKSQCPELVDRLQFCMNAWHTYAHSMECQLEWGPMRVKSAALSDGEGCERNWKNKSGLVGICRGMSSEHRTMLLAWQSMYRGAFERQQLGKNLAARQKNAVAMGLSATEVLKVTIDTLQRSYSGITEDECMVYLEEIAEQQKAWLKRNKEYGKEIDEKFPEVALFEGLRQEYKWTTLAPSYRQAKKFRDLQDRNDKRLNTIGETRGVTWAMGSPKWKEYLEFVTFRNIAQLRDRLLRLFTSKCLELRNLRLRTRGRKTAVEHMKGISSRSGAITKLTDEVNSLQETLPADKRPRKIEASFFDVKTVEQTEGRGLWMCHWDFESKKALIAPSEPATLDFRNDEWLLAGIDAMFRLKRCNEEVVLLQVEWNRIASWALERILNLSQTLQTIQEEDMWGQRWTEQQLNEVQIMLMDVIHCAEGLELFKLKRPNFTMESEAAGLLDEALMKGRTIASRLRATLQTTIGEDSGVLYSFKKPKSGNWQPGHHSRAGRQNTGPTGQDRASSPSLFLSEDDEFDNVDDDEIEDVKSGDEESEDEGDEDEVIQGSLEFEDANIQAGNYLSETELDAGADQEESIYPEGPSWW